MEGNSSTNPFQDPSRTSFESHEMDSLHTHQRQNTSVDSTVALPPNQPRGSCFTSWKLELLSSLLSTAFMLAIVGILLGFDDRPISAWPYGRFSLNSVIALLATGARTSLMFAVTASIGQRKWRWFLPKQYGGWASTNSGPERSFRDFEAFDDSSRSLLGSFKFFGKIGLRYVRKLYWIAYDCRDNCLDYPET